MVDKMMMSNQKKKEVEFFLSEGGIRERMTAARMNYRNTQHETIDQLNRDTKTLKQENALRRKRIRELEGRKDAE
jgi:four helix bundle suffix protein